jgi:hypothetical protein
MFPLDDPFDDPFGHILAAAAQRRAGTVAPAPDPTPQEQSDLLGNLMETSLGGLAYIGKLADKTFGGRAVRGLLGGKPQEALSVLPLSDTLGITNERDTVQGSDLLNQAGLTTKGDDSWENMLAGFGAEVALDPSTYLGIGPVTKAGSLAKKAGVLPRGMAPKLRGFDVAESALKPTLQAGQRVSDVLPRGASMLPEALEQAGVRTGDPLASLIGFGLPGMDPFVTFGHGGPTSLKIAGGLDKIGSAVAGLAPVRAARAILDPSVSGAYNRDAQLLSQEFFRPTSRTMGREAAGGYVDFLQKADPFIAVDQRATADAARLAAEGFDADALHVASSKFGPQQAQELVDLGKNLGTEARKFAPMERDLGVNTSDLLDEFADYLPRKKASIPRQPGESMWAYLSRTGREFGGTHGSQIARDEVFKDIPGGTVAINELAQDPVLKQLSDLQRTHEIEQQFAPHLGADARAKAEMVSKWIGGLPEAYSKDGLDFFRADPFADFAMRADRSAKARAGAETVYEGIKRFARPAADLAAEGTEHVPLPELFNKVGLTATDANGMRRADQIAMTRLGLSNPNDLKGMALPADIARDMVKYGAAWKPNADLGPVVRAWDYASNLFKSMVTVPFPAFHTRNLMSGLFNAWRDDALSPSAMQQAGELVRGGLLEKPLPGMKGTTPEEWTAEALKEMIVGRVAFTPGSGRGADTAVAGTGNLIARLPEHGPKAPVGEQLTSWLGGFVPEKGKVLEQLNPLNVQGVNRAGDSNVVIGQMRKMQSTIDDFVQASHYLAKREQGFAPEAAAIDVKKYHNDYGDLTGVERNVLKRVMPWYSFSRKNLPPLLEDLATKPGKVAAATRLTSGVRDPFSFVPSYIAEGASVPIPGGPEGNQRYISSFGLPIEDELVKALGSAAQGNVTRSLQTILGMGMPQLKAPLEAAFDTQLYSGRKLEDLKPLGSLDNPNLFNEEQSRIASQLLANTPFSRAFTSLDKLTDPRKGTAPTLLNMLTGVRIQDVDEARQKDIAARNLLRETLRGQPGVRVSQDVYIPADKLGLLDPMEQQLYRTYQAANKRVQQQAKANR